MILKIENQIICQNSTWINLESEVFYILKL